MSCVETNFKPTKMHVNDLVHSFICKVSMLISIVSELRIRTIRVAQAFVSALLHCNMGYVLIALCSFVDFMRSLNNLLWFIVFKTKIFDIIYNVSL